ncbi:MAG TPA: tetraacyldisaccharide 4'-kinase, partial [Labilithrix sp.]|nr:tetraacyldisaccharide 4'-kinase [Labilithrix sp.]
MHAPASSVRRAVAGWLETGALGAVWPEALARLQVGFASRALARPLVLPPGLLVVTVGGATLGGSGKTRVALAVTRALARGGARVALIGHAYRAHPGRARVVGAADALAEVGDEALLCARSLGAGGSVVVARSRQEAVDHAASLLVDAIVLDGPLQLTPARASLAILAVDAHAPWGAGALPPAGDLRAPREALLASADLLVAVDAAARLSAAALASLGRQRVGLFTAIGRPARLEEALRGQGVVPAVVVRAPDHGPLTPAL